jgi:hypothetical protein
VREAELRWPRPPRHTLGKRTLLVRSSTVLQFSHTAMSVASQVRKVPEATLWFAPRSAKQRPRTSMGGLQLVFNFEACSGFTLLRPIGSLSGPGPSSQGSDPASCPAEPPASFQTNRQLSG